MHARTQPRSSLAVAAVADVPLPTDAAPVAVSSPAAAACTHRWCRPAAAAAPHYRPHLSSCAACGGRGCGSTWLGLPNSRRDEGRRGLGELLRTGLWAPNWAAICCWADGGCCLRSVWTLAGRCSHTLLIRRFSSYGFSVRLGAKTEEEIDHRTSPINRNRNRKPKKPTFQFDSVGETNIISL
jgi:hypothetical protein